MKTNTTGWGDSTVSTRYIYQRIATILDMSEEDTSYHLSRLMDELARNYRADTNKSIVEEV